MESRAACSCPVPLHSCLLHWLNCLCSCAVKWFCWSREDYIAIICLYTIIFMHLFKQEAIFQVDQLPYSWHGLPRSSASVLESQGWEDEPSCQTPGLAVIAERRERVRNGNEGMSEPLAAYSHLWNYCYSPCPPMEKSYMAFRIAVGFSNLRENAGLINYLT